MFFNFFIFPLLCYNAVSNVATLAFNDLLGIFGITNRAAVSVAALPKLAQLLMFFLVRDFIRFNIHRLLHRIDFLRESHQKGACVF